MRIREVATRRWTRILLGALPPLLLGALFIVTGLRGLNFGVHWDEVDWQLAPVQEMVESGLLMPRAAIYPAFAKWLVLLPALARGVDVGLEVGLEPPAIQAAMVRSVMAPDYLLTVRSVFVVASALAILWVYLAALVARMRVWEATLAASVLGLSWEYAYHARWVATDCVVVQFTALTLLLLFCFLRWGRSGWLYAAAAATGLAIGTKFPAVPLLAPVLVCGAWQLPRRRIGAQLARAIGLGSTAIVAYLVTTPATLFEPFRFVEELRFISGQYSNGHYGYSVTPGWPHVSKVLIYFVLTYFSPYRALSVIASLLVVFGAVVWVRAERKAGVVLVGFPLLFVAFFCSRYSALMVRNYLLLVPCFALLLARGVGQLVQWLPNVWLRALAFGSLILFGIANAAWLVRAGESIRHANLGRSMREAIRYLAETHESYLLSPALTKYAVKRHLSVNPPGKHNRPARVAFVAPTEGPNPYEWPTNDPFAIERVFGPLEVNFAWYPTWMGADHVLVMKLDEAKNIGAPFLKGPKERPLRARYP